MLFRPAQCLDSPRTLAGRVLVGVPFLAGVLWLWASVKPWQTKVFEIELARKDIPLSHYISAGLWFGILAALILGVVLVATARWWNRTLPVQVRQVSWERPSGSLARWFWLGMMLIVVFAAWQRWPAMGHSFWGDEGWAFCDFVHGKWKPVQADGSLQGEIAFDKVRWVQTVFGDRSGNNHWLASILQRATLDSWQWLTGKADWEFDEKVVRLVPMTAGLLSLLAMGLLGRKIGGVFFGWLSALLLALHPLHVRFSIEARGYSLMLLFLILALWAVLLALERGRRRDWLLFGLLQFLVLYSWKGAVYPLAALNALVAGWLWMKTKTRGKECACVLSRWLAANLVGAMLFLPLTLSSNLQIAKSIEEVRRRAKPMNEDWARDAVAETLLGMPWHEQDRLNPHEVSLQRLADRQPWMLVAALGVVGAVGLGSWRFWHSDRLIALLAGAVMAGGVVAVLHFKYVLRVELLTWYLLFSVPLLCLLLARGLYSGWLMSGRNRWGRLVGLASVVAFGLFTLPKTVYFQNLPRENHRKAWELTRGKHELRGFSGPSKVHTGWLWRHTHAYDPRGDTYIRDRRALDRVMTQARLDGGEFYMVVGMRQLSQAVCRDVMAVLRDPQWFDHVETLWGVEHLNTLEVYRMRTTPGESSPMTQIRGR